MSSDNSQDILQRSEQCFIQAEKYFSRSFQRPKIKFDLRGQTAGMAYLEQNLLRFNLQLYQNHQADFLQQTVAHEVAHLIAYEIYGKTIRPHGKEWQSIMQKVYGLPARRCHNYTIVPSWKTRYLYNCDCQEHKFSGQRHALVKRGRQYSCTSCKKKVVFSGEVRRIYG